MKPYLVVFRVRALASLQYRMAALARLAPPLFVGIVQAMFYTAFFAGAGGKQPITLGETITYVWIVQLLVGVQPWSGDPEVLEIIRSGRIAYELCRPLDLYAHWFTRLAARRLVPLLLTSLPLAVIALLLPDSLGMGLPASPAAALGFLLSLGGVVLLSAALSNLLGILTIWTVGGEGVYYLGPVIFLVLSGAAAPLPLFPDGVQPLLEALPFRGLLDTPARIYLGLAAPERALLLVGNQLIWTAGIALFGRWLLSRALKSVVIQGG